MDSNFYNRLANTALRLIDSKGTTCVITSPPQSGGTDAETGMPLPKQPGLVQNAKCVLQNYATSLSSMPNSIIEQNDKKILIAAKVEKKTVPNQAGSDADFAGGSTFAGADILDLSAISVMDLNGFGSTIKIGELEYTIVSIKTINPAGINLVYEVHGRG